MQFRHWSWLLLWPLLVSGTLPAGTAPDRPTRYRVTDLGTLGGDQSYAADLNDRGQVVGYSELEPGESHGHAFLWEKGRMRDLGTLGGENSYASAINRHGDVVGSAYTAEEIECAVLWKKGVARELGALPGGSCPLATDINDRGEIVGVGDTVIANRFGYFRVGRGFLWKNGRMRALDDLEPRPGPGEGQSSALAINNRGVVVGIANALDEFTWPVLWQAGGTHQVRALAPQEGWAYGINDAGQVVGRLVSDDSLPQMQAYTWKNGRAERLPGLTPDSDTVALGINRRGQIVGNSEPLVGEQSAVLWWAGTVTDLNELIPADSGWILQNATAINRSGQIVGSGLHHGEVHAYLLTPR